jgi:hypothetical protein
VLGACSHKTGTAGARVGSIQATVTEAFCA